MKTKLALASIGLLLGYASTASADLFYPELGPIYFQFTNLEQIDIGINGDGSLSNNTSTCSGCSGDPEGNWGIAQLSILRAGSVNPTSALPGDIDNDIDNAGTTPQFADQVVPTLGNQITAIFYGVTQTSISTSGTVISLASTGGFIDLYYDDPGVASGGTAVAIGGETAAVRTADNQAGDWTDGILLARLEFASGIDPTDGTTFIQGTIDSSLANDSGSADSYANVADVDGDGIITDADGAWATLLDSDWFGTVFGTRDVRFSNKIDLNTDWDGAQGGCAQPGTGSCVIGATSNDPGRAFAEQVPEPTTLALLGLGMLGLFGTRRKLS